MKLTTGVAHDLLLGLFAIESTAETKLAGEVRMKIAIDINILKAIAGPYERARAQTYADIVTRMGGWTKVREAGLDRIVEAEMIEADRAMRDSEQELALQTFLKSDLRLDDNPKISGAILAQIMPVLALSAPEKT